MKRGVRPAHPPVDMPASRANMPWGAISEPAAETVPDAAETTAGAAVSGGAGVSVDLLTETYRAHYGTLMRLAALLLDDPHSCEDVVQEAFVRVHVARHRLREPDKTLAYLRQTVVNLSRSTLRRRLMAMRLMPRPVLDEPAAEEGAHEVLERDALVRVLRDLPRRQREVIVLRYYADLTEVQVADLLGLSVGSVKAYGSRGLDALRVRMETS
ncbi:SigE family RNA polymerase sigma factor [Yinghuangia seranimata]|nr:SigE family RNA polymerase sigma factor [Yinghuangia seranimata]MDI2127872.1 SigE family RNA polymerase sigma factor [Yinghuangia seranimata]